MQIKIAAVQVMQLNGRYLRIGDNVIHEKFPEWGVGVVVEEKNSIVTGGISLIRIVFKDGEEKCYINNLDDYNCCYYAGIKLY